MVRELDVHDQRTQVQALAYTLNAPPDNEHGKSSCCTFDSSADTEYQSPDADSCGSAQLIC